MSLLVAFALGVVTAAAAALVLGRPQPTSSVSWSRERREIAKRELDKALAETRRLGWCDGRGECTSVWSRNVRGRAYCSDCGRPKEGQ